VDKIEEVISVLRKKYPDFEFVAMNIPPLEGFKSDTFDVVISFQVIEHIKNDSFYLEEIRRILKPGGKAYITTPNINMTLSRNPWHIREYTPEAFRKLAESIFRKVEMKGIAGNEKVMEYYEQNKQSVKRLMKWDVLDLQHKLPAGLLKIPYELLNRFNRNKLKTGNNALVNDIVYSDYLVSDDPEYALDLFCILEA
jgi:SAM-dependent methyltransferase